jgi:hypothetical protein
MNIRYPTFRSTTASGSLGPASGVSQGVPQHVSATQLLPPRRGIRDAAVHRSVARVQGAWPTA